MITVVRSATIMQGASAEQAFGWAIKVAQYLNQKWGINTQVHRNVGGPLFQLHWIATYDSLAQLEEKTQQFESDPNYAAMLAEVTELSLLSRDSVVDVIYQSVL